MLKGKISWINKDEQYNELQFSGISSGLQLFIKLFFDDYVKNINIKRHEK